MADAAMDDYHASPTHYHNESGITSWIGLISKESLGQSFAINGNPWVLATFCSALVGLTGLLPLLWLTSGKTSSSGLRFMLSFACGGLLGDVFLHLLPEAQQRIHGLGQDPHIAHTMLGLWILLGLLSFIVIEIMCKAGESEGGDGEEGEPKIAVSGYLNLVANCVDNFAHGLAVGGAFLVNNKTGFVTTSCILLHEIPHEIGDFAILMKSGFDRYAAAKAQLCTASLGMIGALSALGLNSLDLVDNATWWILPFTAGGFIQIALVGVLPDLLKSDTWSDFFRVLSGISMGACVMFFLSKL